ncbi:thiopeptide maturation pyridine synthase [Nonomuraea sp. LPB2021202275-12-8]|uniref:thiopeptide maturation pyridine synthase n=1 Tax=Nonomuraea sp. LPB2021202275-12-8 TaxID=3120159 RepID=UPI00300CFA35
MTMPGWHSVHIHHYGDATDRLLVDAVRPVMTELAAHGHRCWFARHWRQGPHVRLHVEAAEEAFRTEVLPVVEARISPYLAELPAAETDTEAMLPLHRRLAEAESESGPLTPWYDDNSWHVEAYDDRLTVHGTPEAAALYTDFMCAANDHAFAVLDRAIQGHVVLAAAFDAMVVVADEFHSDGIAAGYLSFRSHADAYLAQKAGGAAQRRAWEAHFQDRAGVLGARLDALLDPASGAVDDATESLIAALLASRVRGLDLRGRGLLPLGEGTAGDDPALMRDVYRELSPFHRALAENERWLSEVLPSTWFALFRLVLNLMYLQFTRMGLTPFQRYFLCYLVAAAVERRTGRQAVEVLSDFAAAAGGAG